MSAVVSLPAGLSGLSAGIGVTPFSSWIGLVARDGYPQHSTLFSIPLTNVYLDPRLELR